MRSRQARYESMLQQLREFIEAHGRLPRRHEPTVGSSLFTWMIRQRKKFEDGTLTSEQVLELEQLTVNPLEGGMRSQRLASMCAVEAFRYEHGRWPGYSVDPVEMALYETLRRWRRRIKLERHSLSLLQDAQAHHQQLVPVLLGEVQLFTVMDFRFAQRLDTLKRFVEQTGHRPLSSGEPAERALFSWYYQARKAFESGSLSKHSALALGEYLQSAADGDAVRP